MCSIRQGPPRAPLPHTLARTRTCPRAPVVTSSGGFEPKLRATAPARACMDGRAQRRSAQREARYCLRPCRYWAYSSADACMTQCANKTISRVPCCFFVKRGNVSRHTGFPRAHCACAPFAKDRPEHHYRTSSRVRARVLARRWSNRAEASSPSFIISAKHAPQHSATARARACIGGRAQRRSALREALCCLRPRRHWAYSSADLRMTQGAIRSISRVP